jgi:hypothetical protein
MTALFVCAAVTGLYFAVSHARWKLGIASMGILVLAALYLMTARRGRPL